MVYKSLVNYLQFNLGPSGESTGGTMKSRSSNAKANNTLGVRYLSKGRPGKGLYAVKIEIGCYGNRHGKAEYLYEGNDLELATKLANKVNELMQQGGASKVCEFKDYDMEGWLFANGY